MHNQSTITGRKAKHERGKVTHVTIKAGKKLRQLENWKEASSAANWKEAPGNYKNKNMSNAHITPGTYQVCTQHCKILVFGILLSSSWGVTQLI